jgi:hypothetical protein
MSIPSTRSVETLVAGAAPALRAASLRFLALHGRDERDAGARAVGVSPRDHALDVRAAARQRIQHARQPARLVRQFRRPDVYLRDLHRHSRASESVV